MLDKRLTLGGLQVGGPRTMQNSARFRVANNVYQTRDGYFVPRADTEVHSASYLGSTKIEKISRYDSNPFVLATDGSKLIPFDENSALVPSTDIPLTYGSLGIQSREKLGNLYLNIPHKGLFKYDGFQMYRAGTPLPHCDFQSFSSPYTEAYVRVIQHHIDQQGNIVNSGYRERLVRINDSNEIIIRTDKAASLAEGEAPYDIPSLANSYASYYLKASSFTQDVAAGTAIFETAGDHNVKVGMYLINSLSEINFSGKLAYGTAYKVEAFDATTVTVSSPRYMSKSGEWKDDGVGFVSVQTVYLAHYWLSVWTSNTETGNYVYQDTVPAMYESSTAKNFIVSVPSVTTPSSSSAENLFNLPGNMGDIYDVTTVKTVFPFSDSRLPLSFSTYGDLGLISYKNEVYHSDVSLGGSFEMTSGRSFIAVGEGDDGDIQSVCGTEDFMFVSRQFKNYYLSGNIPTANYKVSEIPQTNLGAYSNETSLAVNDKIIFLNKQGIWAIYAGGRCEEVSFNTSGLFDNFSDTTSFSEESYFDLDSYPTYAGAGLSDWIRPRLDVNRGLLAFLIHGGGEGKALVLNMNNGEFYTWDKLIHDQTSPDISDLCFIDGHFYITQNALGVSGVNVEDKDNVTYLATYPAKLANTWFTVGEPSLEKKLNQLKMWGLIDAEVSISHKLDWKESETVDDGIYTNAIPGNFSHKLRLKPNNFLAVSVEMAFRGKFQIEGIEIEFQPFQQGMKR